MEFYKEYTNIKFSALDKLNKEIKDNPQWHSEIKGYLKSGFGTYILVRWVGLSETPFKESEE